MKVTRAVRAVAAVFIVLLMGLAWMGVLSYEIGPDAVWYGAAQFVLLAGVFLWVYTGPTPRFPRQLPRYLGIVAALALAVLFMAEFTLGDLPKSSVSWINFGAWSTFVLSVGLGSATAFLVRDPRGGHCSQARAQVVLVAFALVMFAHVASSVLAVALTLFGMGIEPTMPEPIGEVQGAFLILASIPTLLAAGLVYLVEREEANGDETTLPGMQGALALGGVVLAGVVVVAMASALFAVPEGGERCQGCFSEVFMAPGLAATAAVGVVVAAFGLTDGLGSFLGVANRRQWAEARRRAHHILDLATVQGTLDEQEHARLGNFFASQEQKAFTVDQGSKRIVFLTSLVAFLLLLLLLAALWMTSGAAVPMGFGLFVAWLVGWIGIAVLVTWMVPTGEPTSIPVPEQTMQELTRRLRRMAPEGEQPMPGRADSGPLRRTAESKP